MRYTDLIKHILVLISLGLFTSPAFMQQPGAAAPGAAVQDSKLEKDLKWSFELGGQYTDVSGDRPSKFEEYKSVRKGAIVRRGAIDYNPAGSPAFFSFAMRNASERDQQYAVEGGRYGRFRAGFTWDSQSHLFARGAASLFSTIQNGVYTVPDAIQQNLQALDPPFTNNITTANPALIAGVRNYLSTSSKFDVRSDRQTVNFALNVNLTKHWSVRFHAMETRKSGNRPLGTGTYERTPTVANIGDTFRTHTVELPAQLDQRTDNFTFGSSYVTRAWGVNFDFHLSNFRNNIDSYTYDNPFRFTDQPTTGSGGAYNRMGFSRGLHSAMPDNQSRGFTISAFADLPMASRWAGAFSWERFTQNQQFLPYTLNTAITNQPAGITPTSTASLPRQSLQGEFENYTVDQLFSTRPVKNVTVNLHYRAYDENNKTPHIVLPGYAAYLEAWWRPNISGSYGVRLIENEPASYLRQRASGEVVWDITRRMRWRGEYEWEGWNRTFRQVGRTNEHKFGTFFSFTPVNGFKADIDYRYQKRTPQSYHSGPLENQSLRMFDQNERKRNDLRFKWQWAANGKVGFAGDFSYLNDDYADVGFYGTTQYKEFRGGAELLWNATENTTFYLNYSREHYRTTLQSISKTGTPAFDLNNRWNREDRNVNDNFGVGLSTYLHQDKWFLDMNYSLNNARDLISTVNIGTPVPTALTNATAYPFPEAKYRYHEFSIDTNYQIHPNAALGVRYYFEPFNLDDWQWNTMSPYPNDELAPETDGRKFLLLDARYTSHRAHTISVYIRFGN